MHSENISIESGNKEDQDLCGSVMPPPSDSPLEQNNR